MSDSGNGIPNPITAKGNLRPSLFALVALVLMLAGGEADATNLLVNPVRSLYWLGVPSVAVGEYDKAEQYLQRALSLAKEKLGPESKVVAWCHNDLGALRFVQGRYSEALRYAERGLELKRKLYGPDHYDVFLAMNNVGYAHAGLGNFEAAEEYIRQALEGPAEAERLRARSERLTTTDASTINR